MIDSLAETMV